MKKILLVGNIQHILVQNAPKDYSNSLSQYKLVKPCVQQHYTKSLNILSSKDAQVSIQSKINRKCKVAKFELPKGKVLFLFENQLITETKTRKLLVMMEICSKICSLRDAPLSRPCSVSAVYSNGDGFCLCP